MNPSFYVYWVMVNHIGEVYTNYTVVKKVKGNCRYECRCKCGNVRQIDLGDLKRGNAKSCGCLMVELGLAHGMSGTPEHKIWKAIRTRCNNPNFKAYKDYGGRGIKLHEKYNSFMAFYNDIGPRPSNKHSVDRIDNEKGYEPGNIRWATRKEQANNTRSNTFIEHKGLRLTLAQWGDLAVVDARTIMNRTRRGWDFGRAISTPMKKGRIGYTVPDEKLKEPTKRRVRSWRKRMAADEGLTPPISRL